jgi:flagellar biosynthetic protein FliQ
MTPEYVTGFFLEAIKTAIMLAAPILLAGLVVGILISVIQAATSINEMTMTFIPKMLAVAIALLIFFPWMLQVMIEYTQNLINNLPTVIR